MGGAEAAGGARDACRRAGLEQFERADRRDHHRQPHPAAELLDGSIDLRDVAQHARPERDLVERHAVAAHGGLGLGGADDVVPGVLVEVGARLADQLVQVLELLAAGAEFDRLRRDAGRFVHHVLPGDAFALRYRVPGLRAIPKIAMAGISGVKDALAGFADLALVDQRLLVATRARVNWPETEPRRRCPAPKVRLGCRRLRPSRSRRRPDPWCW